MRFLLPLLGLCCLAAAEDLTTTDGKTYTDYTVTKVEPDGLSIMHSIGTAKVPFSKLSKELQEKHGYDAEKGAAYAKEQAKKLEEAEKAIERDLLMQDLQKATKAFEENVIVATVKVSQVLDDGILGEASFPEQDKVWGEIRVPLGFVKVLGPVSNLVDGSIWKGEVWLAGVYHYENTAGARKTVRCFATDPKVAIARWRAQKREEESRGR